MEEGNSYNQGTWAVKRISSTSGGGQAGVMMSSGYRAALTRDVSVPGESEVLWRHSDLKGPYCAMCIILDLEEDIYNLVNRWLDV